AIVKSAKRTFTAPITSANAFDETIAAQTHTGDLLGCSRDVIRGAIRGHKLSRPLIFGTHRQE
ncbi:MAG: hypothetical protein O0X96_01785, partial [Methanocorpusculum sp.]|nr:hypothetical protein [Methanocorpusculum sp.]